MTDFDGTVRWLLEGTADLLPGLNQAGDDASRQAGARLRASVVGPLRQVAGMPPPTTRGEHDDEVELAGAVSVGAGDPNSPAQGGGRL
jgi:hypothetical protein